MNAARLMAGAAVLVALGLSPALAVQRVVVAEEFIGTG